MVFVAGLYIGYDYHKLKDFAKSAAEKVQVLVTKKEEPEPEVTFVDPDSLEFRVKAEIEATRKALNPDDRP